MLTVEEMRVGFRQVWALQALRNGPIRGKWNLARAIGPHNSNYYGDAVVNRCIARGWIKLSREPGYSGWICTITESGKAVLNARS